MHRIVQFVWILAVLPTISAANVRPVNVTPDFLIKCDISTPGSSISQEFKVTKYDSYKFELMFSFGDILPNDEQIRYLQKFAGGVNSRRGIIAGASKMFSSSGIVIPLHIVIVPLSGTNIAKPIIDKLINTEGIEDGWPKSWAPHVDGSPSLSPYDGLIRPITKVALLPGKYRVTIMSVKETRLPDHVETLLKVVAMHTNPDDH
ncbi:DUF5625 family protein [Ferrovum myxofaciens]|uniref:DUF5625 family protein n=1 Tax=Ferrovum myxofaciens TaxID=416213 RepID=UPI003EBD557B|nr:hypothetical protein [Ferrovum myxofaciens]MBU6995388.1 hypothetical protein [Ferrovum myxofaciens]